MRFFVFICLLACFIFACSPKKDNHLFTIRQGDELGIDFKNSIITSDTFNAVTFEYIYNGSGVGVGDFNNDGLADLFFGGNQVSSKLYLNQGELQFLDITSQAGVSTNRWVTGVSVIDINADGLQDIYLSVAGKTTPANRRNLLFVNQGVRHGIPVFEEAAKRFGLDDDGYCTMAAFFDYDKDGDQDMYLLNNWLENFNRNNLRPKRINGEAESTDKLYRNNGNNTFTNVSREAGILVEGYGLGINICDLNQDSWPDVYVSNDFMSNDLIWINQQDGTFKNQAGEYLKHQTHNGMGVDIADFNNDGLADIIEVDMLPPDHKRQKLMTPGQNYDHFHMALQMGYQPQYMRNTLQLNRGKFADGHVRFSEIAFMAGVAKTDWSWAPLFADFDNDGYKDLFIANGYRKDVTNLDFIFFGMENDPYGTTETRRKKYWTELEKLPKVQTSNYIFRNNGSLHFEDKTTEWGVKLPTYSNGTAYADFDNDGDLDLVTNNIDQEVIFYENTAQSQKEKNHFVRIVISDGFNQNVSVFTHDKKQYQEVTPYRGFQSSVANYAHFGIGTSTVVDSIIVQWPDSAVARYYSLKADTILMVNKKDATPIVHTRNVSTALFQEIDMLDYTHHEASPSDIKNTRTLLHELSHFGPCMASADVNGDGLDDLLIGAEANTPTQLFIQQKQGTFQPKPLGREITREDGAALFFDSDNDGDVDLYMGGTCASSTQEPAVHQLYINDGKGNFTLSNALPEIKTAASCVVSSDYDGDGDQDLFVGGRVTPNAYPLPPRSYLLRNNNGVFNDVTKAMNTALENPGMVSTAVWTDMDNDAQPDLVITGEWMPIRVFKNTGSAFKEVTRELGLEKSNGWWNCLKAADVNADGWMDIVAGNTGTNSYFQPTETEPIQIAAKDFDKNGSVDPIVTYFNKEEKQRFMVHNRLVIIDQIPSIKRRFETFTQFATTPFHKAFTEDELAGAYQGNAYTLASSVLINQGGKKIELVDLPEIAQLSTINDLAVEDINADGHADLLLIGNSYAQETLFGRYDASLGTVLLGNGKAQWKNVEPSTCQWLVDGDARQIQVIRTPQGKVLVIANNNAPLETYRMLHSQK